MSYAPPFLPVYENPPDPAVLNRVAASLCPISGLTPSERAEHAYRVAADATAAMFAPRTKYPPRYLTGPGRTTIQGSATGAREDRS